MTNRCSTALPLLGAMQDTLYTYVVSASDPDAGQTASLSITATTVPAWLSLSTNGGGSETLSGTPTNVDVGDHAVSLLVTDPDGLTATQDFTVTVANVNDQPSITSTPPAAGATQGVLYSYAITAADPDVGETAMLSFVASTKPAWLTFTDNSDGTATLSGTPSSADIGIDNSVTIEVSDPGGLSDTQSFTVNVTNVVDGPSFTSSPPAAGATQDAAYTYNITATDPDPGETAQLSFAATTLPAWLTLTDNNDGTATLSGTPGAVDVFTNNDVVIEVSDPGGLSDTQSFTVDVANVNDAPVFTSMPITAVTEGSAYSYTITVVDPDLDGVTISATTLPAWLTFMDNGDGTATLTGSPTGAEVGDHAVDIQTQEVAPAPGLMAQPAVRYYRGRCCGWAGHYTGRRRQCHNRYQPGVYGRRCNRERSPGWRPYGDDRCR